jgi:class 3 adenylate cyclase
MPDLPSGTVTFLFTDLEGSTRLWEEQPEAMQTALARHDVLLRLAVEANGGRVVKSTGDGLHAVFGGRWRRFARRPRARGRWGLRSGG